MKIEQFKTRVTTACCILPCVISGCAFSPMVFNDRGVAIGVFQSQHIQDRDSIEYYRHAGYGISLWSGRFTVGHTDQMYLKIDPRGGPISFVSPQIKFGTETQIEIMTGSTAENWADHAKLSSQITTYSSSACSERSFFSLSPITGVP